MKKGSWIGFVVVLVAAILGSAPQDAQARGTGRGAPVAPGAPGDQADIPFEELAASFLAAHCPADSLEAPCELEDLLAGGFARVDLGAFRVWYPAAYLEKRERGKELAEAVGALVGLEREWVDWLLGETPGETADSFRVVSKWVKGWKPSELAKLAEEEAEVLDVTEALSAPEEARQALARIRALLHAPEEVGVALGEDELVSVVLCPDRRSFLETVAYAGLLSPIYRRAFWVPGVDQWVRAQVGRTLVLALEYPPWDGFDPEFKTGVSLKRFEDTGLAEHVVHRSATALLVRALGKVQLDRLEAAIPLNLTIAVCGQVNTMDEAGVRSMSGAETQAYELFVPGGNPAGGWLPPISALPLVSLQENHWRQGGGEDHFVKVLRAGQAAGQGESAKASRKKDGKKNGKNGAAGDKLSRFALESLDGSTTFVVQAPFFGPHADEKPYPPEPFLTDYREFFRAYGTAFLFWLRSEGVKGSPEESEARFRTLLRGLGTGIFEDQIAAIYEQPISGADGEAESLEWRFLSWLKR